MSALASNCTKLTIVAFSLFLLALNGVAGTARAEDACLEHARELLRHVPAEKQPDLKIDTSLSNPEAFSIRTEGGKGRIVGGGPAGALYGVGQWLAPAGCRGDVRREKPDFELRGTALFLMKEGRYDYQLTPQEFPWFFDRPLLTRYLDYLLPTASTRFSFGVGICFPASSRCPSIPTPRT